MEAVLFYLFGALLLFSSIIAMCSRSAVAAVVWLIFAFINAAGIYALLSASMLAVLQVLVYAGAILVLFLFVVMMMQGPSLKSEAKLFNDKKWFFPIGAIVISLIPWLRSADFPPFPESPAADFGSFASVANLLLNKYVIVFEMISLVLLVAIIGAVALGRNKKGMPW